jgi:antitoxin (DNA-binding transcriptional repressor) of toxin-antitoxin stability system
MATVNVAQANARLSELLDKTEAGEDVITRQGHAVAHLHSARLPKRPLMLDDLAAFRATMPSLRRPSVELLPEMRDEGAGRVSPGGHS